MAARTAEKLDRRGGGYNANVSQSCSYIPRQLYAFCDKRKGDKRRKMVGTNGSSPTYHAGGGGGFDISFRSPPTSLLAISVHVYVESGMNGV